MKELDDYSKRFARVLFEAFPGWERFASVAASREHGPEGHLVVEVPAPAESAHPAGLASEGGDCLRITSDGEITIAFDYYHTHFDRSFGLLEEDGFDQAIECVRSIINEQVCVAVVVDGGEWHGALSVAAGAEPDLRDWGWLDLPGGHVYVRSWRGAYNHTFAFAEARGNTRGAI